MQKECERESKTGAKRMREREEHRCKKSERQMSRAEKISMNQYLSTITLSIKGLNIPIKRHSVADGQENMTHIYAAYKRLTSGW